MFTHTSHPVFTHTSHPVLAPSSRPVLGIHCPCVRSPIPHLLKYSKAQSTLNRLKVLDIYSHVNPKFHRIPSRRGMRIDTWIPYLTSLRTVVFPIVWGCLGKFIDALFQDPHMCPALTTITSLFYPGSWISLCNCLEIRNHLSLRNRSVQAIHTLRFPSAVHGNIRGPLQGALSGEFAAPLVTIPRHPWTLYELAPASPARQLPPEAACSGCYRSGHTFKCEGGAIEACSRHWSQGVAINAYRGDISGYLEWKPKKTVN